MARYDLDVQEEFQTCMRQLGSVSTRNLAVDFDAHEAFCAVDVNVARIEGLLLDTNTAKNHRTRWINFWGWHADQTKSMDVVAKKYNLSPRLMDLLWPGVPCQPPAEDSTTTQKPPTVHTTDIEKGVQSESASTQSQSRHIPMFAQIMNHRWHFYSVDWGQHYLYIGFNSLFILPGQSLDAASDRPVGQRLWTSLLLCDDGTVITVFEGPPPKVMLDTAAVTSIRRNVLNVFQHLSRLHSSTTVPSLSRVTVRPSHDNQPSTCKDSNETASLLFYYLFDDWLSSYALIAQPEHSYRRELERVRKHMFDSADVGLIESLHHLGRQLTVLKLMYQSKELIVRRILQRRFTTLQSHPQGPWALFNHQVASDGAGSSPMMSSLNHGFEDDMIPVHDLPQSGPNIRNEAGHRVSISLSARFRFERLLDRIQLLAQTEIDECIKEKESLTFMNFNLVALKESQAVEKLTRTTVVLAKATILFLPVSLMTGYFSIEIGNIQDIYSLKTYWLSFVVVTIMSVGVLSVMGVANSIVQGRTVYKSLTKWAWDKGKEKKRKET